MIRKSGQFLLLFEIYISILSIEMKIKGMADGGFEFYKIEFDLHTFDCLFAGFWNL